MIRSDEIAQRIYRISFYDEPDLAGIAAPGASYNMFLVAAQQPAIVNTMFRRTFERLRDQVAKILDPASLRYIVVPHHEGDSSGALNEWLKAAPRAVPVCSELCAFLSLRDFSTKGPMVVADGQVIDLGTHRLRFVITPQVNQWDSLMVCEETTGTLFPNDLFSSFGVDVSTDKNVARDNLEGARQVGYLPDDRLALTRALDKIEALRLKLLGPMHGPSLTGHFRELIRAYRENSVALAGAESVLVVAQRSRA